MIFSFLICCQSKTFEVNQTGYKFFPVNPGDYVSIKAYDSTNSYIYWEQDIEIPVTIYLCYKDGQCYNHTFIGDGGLQLNSQTSFLTFQSSITVHTWLLPENYCQGKSIAYSTKQNLLDTLSLSESLSSLCVFFPNKNDKISIKLNTNDNLHKTKFYVLTEKMKPYKNCDEYKCAAGFDKPVFLQFFNISEKSLISLEFNLNRKRENITCSRNHLSLINHSQIIYSGFGTQTSVLTCPETFFSPFNLSFLLLMFGVIFAVIAFVLLWRKFFPICTGQQPYHDMDKQTGFEPAEQEHIINDDENLVNEEIVL